jgi:hypothetical protein
VQAALCADIKDGGSPRARSWRNQLFFFVASLRKRSGFNVDETSEADRADAFIQTMFLANVVAALYLRSFGG